MLYKLKMMEKLKSWFQINFILRFTTTKLLAYIIVFLGSALSAYIKSETPFIVAVGAAAAMMATKTMSDNTAKVNIEKVNATNPDKASSPI